ncbi:hypothetical protein ACSSVY_004119 [Roseovarius sp. MBR-51]
MIPPTREIILNFHGTGTFHAGVHAEGQFSVTINTHGFYSLAWTSSGVKIPWVEWGRSAL